MPGAHADEMTEALERDARPALTPPWGEDDHDWSLGVTHAHDIVSPPDSHPTRRRLLHVGSGLADAPPRAQTMYRPRHSVPGMRARALLAALGRAGAAQVVVTDSPRRPATSAPRTRFHLVGRTFAAPWGRKRQMRVPLPVGAATVIGGTAIGGSDSLHVHLDGPGGQAVVGLVLGLAPTRLVVHVGDLAGHGLRSGRRTTLTERLVDNAIEQVLLRRADLIVATTDRLAEAVGKMGNGKTLVIPPPPLPVTAMVSAPAAMPFPSITGRRIVSVGPLIARRQPHALVDALAVQPPDTHLFLMGTGPESLPIARHAKSLRLGDRVHVIPTASWETVVGHIRHADVVVTAALAGDDIFESQVAAQVGTPVVASNTEGFPRQISDRIDGRLFDPLDLDQLSGAIRDVLVDPEAAAEMIASAARRSRARTWDSVAAALLEVTA